MQILNSCAEGENEEKEVTSRIERSQEKKKKKALRVIDTM